MCFFLGEWLGGLVVGEWCSGECLGQYDWWEKQTERLSI